MPRPATLIALLLLPLLLLGCTRQATEAYNTRTEKRVVEAAGPNKVLASQYNVQLGMGYLERNDNARAREKLLLALKQDPASSEAHGAMAYFLERTGQNEQATFYYKRAIRLSQGSGEAYNNYGVFLCRNGHYREALKQFSHAVRDRRYIHMGDAYENAGLCAMEMGNIAEARRALTRAIEEDVQRHTAYIVLAQIYYNAENYTKVRDVLEQFNYFSEDTEETLWMKAQIAEHLGQQQEIPESVTSELEMDYPNHQQPKQT